MTIEQAIYSVFDGTGKTSDDFPVSKRFVYSELKNIYQQYAKQDMNKLRGWDGGQTLRCLELVRMDAADCMDCESGIYILRSKEPLPEIIDTDYGLAITGVFLMNGVSIDKTDRISWMRDKKRRYNLPNSTGYFLMNKYLVVVNHDDVDELLVDVAAYYSDPEVVTIKNMATEGCTDGKNCQPVYMTEFECPGHLLYRVIETARQPVLRRLGIPIDGNNNNRSDIIANVKSNAQPPTD